jgi:hypothetical protein
MIGYSSERLVVFVFPLARERSEVAVFIFDWRQGFAGSKCFLSQFDPPLCEKPIQFTLELGERLVSQKVQLAMSCRVVQWSS